MFAFFFSNKHKTINRDVHPCVYLALLSFHKKQLTQITTSLHDTKMGHASVYFPTGHSVRQLLWSSTNVKAKKIFPTVK